MKITSRIDGTEIGFDLDTDKRYGILLSGGIDSAVLLFAILAEYQQRNTGPSIQIFSIPKSDGSTARVPGIIEYLNSRFGFSIPTQPTFVGDTALHHNEMNVSAFEEIFNSGKYQVDFLFNAVNQNPPEPFKMRGTYPNRVTAPSASGKSIRPFLMLHKTHVMDLMAQLGAEELLNLTHTCTEQTEGRCNVCFQCDERAWALTQLGITDTGKM